MKIHITFYKHILNINSGSNAQKKYLPIELLPNYLAVLFIEKTRFSSIFFSDSEFWMRVYKGKIVTRNEGVRSYTFLSISPRKINVLKKTKLYPRELNKVDELNKKRLLLNLMNIL